MEKLTVPQLFEQTARQLGDKVALRHKKYGLWHDTTWGNYYKQARNVAYSLLRLGLKKGEFVAIIGDNAPEWVIIDMGVQMIGGVSVGIYTTSSWEQMQYIINHAECKFIFAENEEQVDKWLQMRKSTPQVEKVIYWDEKGLKELEDPGLIAYPEFLKLGAFPDTKEEKKLEEISASIQPDDLAILVYTSGTTGPPKGAMLSHRNLIWTGKMIQEADPGNLVKYNDQVMSFLPLCHIFERLFSVYVHLTVGYTVSFVESPDTVPQNLREISPTIGYAVPRIWEKYYSTIAIKMDDAKPIKRWVYRQALKIGKAHARYSIQHKKAPLPLRLANFMVQKGVFYFLRQRLGMERMRLAISGAAPISPDVLRFFHAIGLKMIEGYGMTESSGIITISRLDSFKLGTVGQIVPNGEIRISEEGEIQVNHPGVFQGYYKNPKASAATIVDGWLYTGDIGEMDEQGFIRIVDRKKDIIITAGGKNIAPQYIENKLKFSPFINDAIIIGDRIKFISAIIVLDEDNVNKYAQDNKIQFSTYADLATHPDIIQLIDREVDKVNKQLARVESIRKFTILSKKLYEEDGEVTPTMKVKRRYINETYSELIEGMYH